MAESVTSVLVVGRLRGVVEAAVRQYPDLWPTASHRARVRICHESRGVDPHAVEMGDETAGGAGVGTSVAAQRR